jgi:hypothetical protein
MERMQETFNPVYNNVEQVKKCTCFMLCEEMKDAKIAIVIGHNGRNFISSTDWRLTTVSGLKRIFPFSVRPQYPNFVECVAGAKYDVKDSMFSIVPDGGGLYPANTIKKGAIVIIGEQSYNFAPGEALKIYVNSGEKFIATDCDVTCEEQEKVRIYRIIPNEQTLYGKLDEKGSISQV